MTISRAEFEELVEAEYHQRCDELRAIREIDDADKDELFDAAYDLIASQYEVKA